MKNLIVLIFAILSFKGSSDEELLKLEVKVIRSTKNNKTLTKVVCIYKNDSDSLYYLSNPLCRVNLNFLPMHGRVRLQPTGYFLPNLDCLSTVITLQPHSKQEFVLKEYLETYYQDVNSKDTTTLKIIYYGRIVSGGLKPCNKVLESNQIMVNY